MKRTLLLVFVAALVALPASAGQKQASQNGITVAGTTEGNTGCMVLEKHMPIKGKLLFAGVIYARTEYTVVQTFNYKPEKQKFTGQGEINKLNQEAVRDKVKLVVVPSKYTPDQLAEARKMCRK